MSCWDSDARVMCRYPLGSNGVATMIAAEKSQSVWVLDIVELV